MSADKRHHQPTPNYQSAKFSAADYRLLRGVIKSLGISAARSDYEDLLQEGALILLEARQSAKKLPYLSYKKRQNYYFSRIRWRLLDILRSQQTKKITALSLEQDDPNQDNQPLEAPDPQAAAFADNLLVGEYAKQLWQMCTAKEQLYLAYRLQSKNITEIARLCGVTRPTVYRWKEGVVAKLKQLSEQL